MPNMSTALLAAADVPPQSMVHPAGPAAAEIAWLWWLMFWAFTGVFLVVIGLLFFAIALRRDRDQLPPWGRTGFIVAGGVVLPMVILTPLFIVTLVSSTKLHTPEDVLTIEVRGRMWWWEVRYPQPQIVTANELHIPAGRPVRLELTSADVIHSFWVPRLNGKRDMIPGLKTVFWIHADEPGVYRGQCGEYCGTQHANMAFEVIAHEPAEFEGWLATHSSPNLEPDSDAESRGAKVFHSAGCAQCHAVRGTHATSNAGPDLTHIGSRRTIGAALLPNTRGNLAGWIADPQGVKPGAKMPRTYLPAEDLHDLVTYLEGLK